MNSTAHISMSHITMCVSMLPCKIRKRYFHTTAEIVFINTLKYQQNSPKKFTGLGDVQKCLVLCLQWWHRWTSISPLLLLVCMSLTIIGQPQRPHPQSVAEISRHSVLSGDRIRQCGISSGSRHKDTDKCLYVASSFCRHRSVAVPCENG